MDKRQDKINLLLQKEVAQIIAQEVQFPEALVSVAKLTTDNNASELRIKISVLPEKFTGTVLKELRKKSSFLAKEIHRKARLKRVPKIFWSVEEKDDVYALEEILNSF
jgi:ribosome-binding factor A